MPMIWALGIAALLAGLWTAFVFFANGMRSGSGKFVGAGTIWAAWLVVLILLVLLVSPAKAQEHRHPPEHQSLHDRFYSTWTMPDARHISCCHGEDCKPAQSRHMDGKWQSRHSDDDDWADVPAYKIETERDSPDGQSHLCGRKTWHGFTVYCFLPAASG